MSILFALIMASEPTGTVSGHVRGISGAPWYLYIESSNKASNVPPKKARLAQRNTQFEPNVIVVVRGATVEFPNEDKAYHNVFSVTEGNDFDLGMYRAGASKSVELKQTGEVDVYCNVHANMSAKILVLQNELFCAGADGACAITGVPPGQYTVVAWSPLTDPEKVQVTVRAGQTAEVDLAPHPRTAQSGHANKDGEPYGRYK